MPTYRNARALRPFTIATVSLLVLTSGSLAALSEEADQPQVSEVGDPAVDGLADPPSDQDAPAGDGAGGELDQTDPGTSEEAQAGDVTEVSPPTDPPGTDGAGTSEDVSDVAPTSGDLVPSSDPVPPDGSVTDSPDSRGSAPEATDEPEPPAAPAEEPDGAAQLAPPAGPTETDDGLGTPEGPSHGVPTSDVPVVPSAPGEDPSQDQAADSTGEDAATTDSATPTTVDATSIELDQVTGSILVVGNRSSDTVTQSVTLELLDRALVLIEQFVLIVNIGLAQAATGLDDLQLVPSSSDGTAGAGVGAALVTGDAVAIGNYADVRIEQLQGIAAIAFDDVRAEQSSQVVSVGESEVSTGANTSVGGTLAPDGDGLVAATGDAVAIGNAASTTIEQDQMTLAAGTSRVSATQTASSTTIGVATAVTGDNQLIAGVPAGTTVTATTGFAAAFGNETTTSISQAVEVRASDDAWVWIYQGAAAINVGAAVARTGAGSPSSTELIDLRPEIALIGVDLLADTVDWLQVVQRILGRLRDLLGRDLSLNAWEHSHWEESHSTESGGSGTIRQRALVLNLGEAYGSTASGSIPLDAPGGWDPAEPTEGHPGDGYVDRHPGGQAVDDQPGSASLPDLGTITIETGFAGGLGNLSVDRICQELYVNVGEPTSVCNPPPPPQPEEPEPKPGPAPDPEPAPGVAPIQPPSPPVPYEPIETPGTEPEEPAAPAEEEPVVLPSEITRPPTPARPVTALPATGADTGTLLPAGLGSTVLGLLLVALSGAGRRRGAPRRRPPGSRAR